MIGAEKGIEMLGTGVIYPLGHYLAAMVFHGIPSPFTQKYIYSISLASPPLVGRTSLYCLFEHILRHQWGGWASQYRVVACNESLQKVN